MVHAGHTRVDDRQQRVATVMLTTCRKKRKNERKSCDTSGRRREREIGILLIYDTFLPCQSFSLCPVASFCTKVSHGSRSAARHMRHLRHLTPATLLLASQWRGWILLSGRCHYATLCQEQRLAGHHPAVPCLLHRVSRLFALGRRLFWRGRCGNVPLRTSKPLLCSRI